MEDEYDTVQVLVKGPDDVLELNTLGLKTVLKKTWDKPVALIAICGDKRKGKSFILNMFLQFLVKGLPKKSTLSYMWGSKVGLHAAFDWRGGPKRNTEGIWILNRPIMVNTSNGQVALYLMDTQGMFDSQTSKKECSQIFALATLMSSHLVFNLMRQIQANDLEYLDFWTQTAKYVNSGADEAFFQNLLFLIRDFPFPDYGFGIQAGERYLQEELKESDDKTASVNENIRNLRHVFTSVKAFGMPTPDKSVTSRKEEDKPIDLGSAGNQFLQHAGDLFKYLQSNLTPLDLNGKPMNGEQLFDYVSTCCDNLLSDQVPDPYTLSESVAKFQLGKLMEQEKKQYESDMKNTLETFTGSLADLYQYHQLLLLETLGRFDNISKFGRGDVIVDYRNMLEIDIAEIYDAMSSYYAKKLELQDSENRREDEAKIAKHREDLLSGMMKKQEEQMKEAAEQHAKEAMEMKRRLEEQERRFQEAEEKRQQDAEDQKRLLEEQQRLYKEAEIARKREAAEAKLRFQEQKQEIRRMADDNSQQAEEAKKQFKEMEARYRIQEENRKQEAERDRQRYEDQKEAFKQQQEARERDSQAARQQQQKMFDAIKAQDDRRYEDAKAARERTEKSLELMRQQMNQMNKRRKNDGCVIS